MTADRFRIPSASHSAAGAVCFLVAVVALAIMAGAALAARPADLDSLTARSEFSARIVELAKANPAMCGVDIAKCVARGEGVAKSLAAGEYLETYFAQFDDGRHISARLGVPKTHGGCLEVGVDMFEKVAVDTWVAIFGLPPHSQSAAEHYLLVSEALEVGDRQVGAVSLHVTKGSTGMRLTLGSLWGTIDWPYNQQVLAFLARTGNSIRLARGPARMTYVGVDNARLAITQGGLVFVYAASDPTETTPSADVPTGIRTKMNADDYEWFMGESCKVAGKQLARCLSKRCRRKTDLTGWTSTRGHSDDFALSVSIPDDAKCAQEVYACKGLHGVREPPTYTTLDCFCRLPRGGTHGKPICALPRP